MIVTKELRTYSRYFVKCLSPIAAVYISSALNTQTKISTSVLGNGGTPTGSSRFKISGTAGQAAIGVASSQSNVANSGFWVQAVDIVTEVEQQAGEEIPTRFRLHQNYPNPFNPETTIPYDLPGQADVRLTIFDVLGRTVRTLVEQKQPAGAHLVLWYGRDDSGQQLASGLYLYHLEAGNFRKTAKMLLLK